MNLLTNTTKGLAHAQARRPVSRVQERIKETLREFTYCTRRHLHKQTGIEIATLCGALAALEKKGIVKTPFSVTCETTGKEVVVYCLNTSEDE